MDCMSCLPVWIFGNKMCNLCPKIRHFGLNHPIYVNPSTKKGLHAENQLFLVSKSMILPQKVQFLPKTYKIGCDRQAICIQTMQG